MTSPRDLRRPCFNNRRTNDAKAPRRLALSEGDRRAQRKLQLACLFSLLFMCAEVVGGYLAGSLAIMSDGAHSLFAIWMTQRPATGRLSYGFQRSEVTGAATSILVIWVLTGVLLYEAVERFLDCLKPEPATRVDSKLMFIVATIGLLVNLMLMKILSHGHSHGGHGHSHGGHGHSHEGHSHGGHSHGSHGTGILMGTLTGTTTKMRMGPRTPIAFKYHALEDRENWVRGDLEVSAGDTEPQSKKKLENLNIRSAFIHALGDFFRSLGVCIAGGLIWFKPEWQIADPIATFVFSILVVGTTVGIIRDSIHMLMEGTPLDTDTKDIEEGLQNCPSVVGVHDLHIWSLVAVAECALGVR